MSILHSIYWRSLYTGSWERNIPIRRRKHVSKRKLCGISQVSAFIMFRIGTQGNGIQMQRTIHNGDNKVQSAVNEVRNILGQMENKAVVNPKSGPEVIMTKCKIKQSCDNVKSSNFEIMTNEFHSKSL
jgi:hypothetical protein